MAQSPSVHGILSCTGAHSTRTAELDPFLSPFGVVYRVPQDRKLAIHPRMRPTAAGHVWDRGACGDQQSHCSPGLSRSRKHVPWAQVSKQLLPGARRPHPRTDRPPGDCVAQTVDQLSLCLGPRVSSRDSGSPNELRLPGPGGLLRPLPPLPWGREGPLSSDVCDEMRLVPSQGAGHAKALQCCWLSATIGLFCSPKR